MLQPMNLVISTLVITSKLTRQLVKLPLMHLHLTLTGLQSLRLGSLGGLIGASVNEFSTDGTLSQNSDSEKVPTQQAVKTYVDNLSNIAGNLTIGGNLTVSGTTTTVNTANTTISDKLLELASGTEGSPSGDAGIIIERGTSTNIFIGFDEDQNEIRFAETTATGAILEI